MPATVRQDLDAQLVADMQERANRSNARVLRASRRHLDAAARRVQRGHDRLTRAQAYRTELTANTDDFASRARQHYRNQTFVLVFICLLPGVYLYDFAFTFPALSNALSGVALARYFPSLNTWQGQMRLCLMFSLAALVLSLALKLITETHGDVEERLNSPSHGYEAMRLRRRIVVKNLVRVFYIALLVGAAAQAWNDSVARSALAARATGVATTANPALLVVLSGSVAMHAVLLWFPCYFLYHDPLSPRFVCPPHQLERYSEASRNQRADGAVRLQRIVGDAPREVQGLLAAEIHPEIRRISNEALGQRYFVENGLAAGGAAGEQQQAGATEGQAGGAVGDPGTARGGFQRVL